MLVLSFTPPGVRDNNSGGVFMFLKITAPLAAGASDGATTEDSRVYDGAAKTVRPVSWVPAQLRGPVARSGYPAGVAGRRDGADLLQQSAGRLGVHPQTAGLARGGVQANRHFRESR